MVRTFEDVQREYVNACTKLGEMSFRLEVGLPEEINKLHTTIHNLEREAQKFLKEAAEKQKAEAAAKAKEELPTGAGQSVAHSFEPAVKQ